MEQTAKIRMRWRLGQEQALSMVIVLAVAVFGLATPNFLSLSNLLNIGQQTAVIAIVAYALTAVIICKGIDISVGSVLAASGMLTAVFMHWAGITGWLAIPIVLIVGALFGLLNGVLISFVGISPFVTTLAVYALARGVALSVSGAQSVGIDNPVYLWFGQAMISGLPVSLLVAIFVGGLWYVLMQRTVFGRWLYAVGGNEDAARASLIPVRTTRMLIYVLAGASSGLGAMLTSGRLGSAQPLAGMGLEFAAITAAIIGGARLSGGHGSILGTALGAVLLGVVNTGLAFLQVSQQATYFVTGGLVLVAVLIGQGGTVALLKSFLAWRPSVSVKSDASASQRSAIRSLELLNIGKRFPGVQALSDVSMQLVGGEVVALVGENGAGKSTLVKVLSGIHRPEDGDLILDGSIVKLQSPAHSRAAGIAVIHQHFSLVPELTVAENLAFAQSELPLRGKLFLNRGAMRKKAGEVLKILGLTISPDAKVSELSIGQCQMVEVAKALMADAWLIVMDEPTSALTNLERDQLYHMVRMLVARQCCVLYISHKMEEVYTLASRAVVLRDGRCVGEADLDATVEADLIGMMVGREIKDVFPYVPAVTGERILEIKGLGDDVLLQGINLTVRSGELVALTGLMGSGRSEIMRCVSGMATYSEGTISIQGNGIPSGDAPQASKLGVAYVPEDRHKEGFVGSMSLRDNFAMRWMRQNSRAGWLDHKGMDELSDRMIEQLGVRPRNSANLVANLSGGNQQKIVIGKCLAIGPKLLLLDEPTNGVDVGAKFEIHTLIAELKKQGLAILMVSSELPEVLGVADRIVVLSGGRVAGELPRGASEEQVMNLAFKKAAGVKSA